MAVWRVLWGLWRWWVRLTVGLCSVAMLGLCLAVGVVLVFGVGAFNRFQNIILLYPAAGCGASDPTNTSYYLCVDAPMTVSVAANTAYTLPGGSISTPSLQTAATVGRVISDADSFADAVRIGDGTLFAALYTDPTDGPVLKFFNGATPLTENVRIYDGDPRGTFDQDNNLLTNQDDTGSLTFSTGAQLIASNLGVEFSESNTNPTCAAGNYSIYADTSEAKLKACQNGTPSDLLGAGGGAGDIEGVTAGVGLSGGGTTGTVTVTFDPTEVSGAITWGDNSQASQVVTRNLSGTDVVETYSSGLLTLTGGLTVSGATILTGNSVIGDGSQATRTLTANLSGTDVVETYSSGLLTITGGLAASTTLASVGDFAVNSTMFTVAGASGNTVVAGTLLATGVATFTAAPVFQTPPTYGTTDPLKSLWVPAGAMSISGTCTDTAPAERTIVTNGPKLMTIEPADGDSCSVEFDWVSPDAWNAGTITVELAVFSTGNNTTEVFAMDCAGQAVSDGDPVVAHATTGEQEASCTFGAQAFDEQHCTTPAITIQGTPAAGDHVFMRCQVDASASTVSPFTDLRLLGAKIEYGVGTSTDN